MAESHDKTYADPMPLMHLLRTAVERATFSTRRHGVLDSAGFLNLYRDNGNLLQAQLLALEPDLEQGLRAELTDCLQSLLTEFLDGDHIGIGFGSLVGGRHILRLPELVSRVVCTAVMLGPDTAVELLCGWAKGRTVPYRLNALLSNITSQHPMEMAGGIHLQPLPGRSSQLATYVPETLLAMLHEGERIGGLKLTIPCELTPAFFRPGEGNPVPQQQRWVHGDIPANWANIFCEALSLVLNHCVTWTVSWADCEAARAFGVGGSLASMNYMLGPHFGSPPGDTMLSEAHLPEVTSLLSKRLTKGSKRESLSIAIDRWMRSKATPRSIDQLIELRVALEALYLKGNKGEVGFRLANYGAWHLGASFDERRKYQKTLKRAYDLASNVVHPRAVKHKDKDYEVLIDAQNLCRKGILQRLDETKEPNWNELILGKDA